MGMYSDMPDAADIIGNVVNIGVIEDLKWW